MSRSRTAILASNRLRAKAQKDRLAICESALADWQLKSLLLWCEMFGKNDVQKSAERIMRRMNQIVPNWKEL